MRPHFGFGAKPRKRNGLSRTLNPAPSAQNFKEMGSATANPGLLSSSSSNVPTVLKSSLTDINGTTFQESPSQFKFKYKYKYPNSKKRKTSDPGFDDLHMQAKALPGEQYRGGAGMRVPPYKKMRNDDPPPIEPRSVPGDQYLEDASINSDVKRENDVKEKESDLTTKAHESIVNTAFWTNMANSIFITLRATGIFSYLAPAELEVVDRMHNTFIYLSKLSGVAAAVSYSIKHAQSVIKTDFDMSVWDKAYENANDFLSRVKEIIEKKEIPIDKGPILKELGRLEEAENSMNEEVKRVQFTSPKGVGEQPGESSIPEANTEAVPAGISVGPKDISNEGEEPEQAYKGEEQKAIQGDPNRLDPITPATGSRQTSATANSLVSVKKLKAAAERAAKIYGIEAVHGNARERANMGKGALDTYEFQGPYDYPVYPGGRPDDTLTMMGAWRTNGGNDSSLWYSKRTAKGANAKRNKYFKWSAKGGGRWRKLSKDDMVNVIQKGQQSDNRFYGTRTNLKFAEFQRRRDQSVKLAEKGNTLVVNANHGYGSHGRDKYKDRNKVGVYTEKDVPPVSSIGEREQGFVEGSGNNTVGEPKKTMSEMMDEL